MKNEIDLSKLASWLVFYIAQIERFWSLFSLVVPSYFTIVYLLHFLHPKPIFTAPNGMCPLELYIFLLFFVTVLPLLIYSVLFEVLGLKESQKKVRFVGDLKRKRQNPSDCQWIVPLNAVLVNGLFVVLFPYLMFATKDHHGKFVIYVQHDIGVRTLGTIAVASILADVFFTAVHYGFHKVPRLYRLHKMHHAYRFPDYSATYYVHPLEHILNNLLPIVLAGWICQLSPNVTLHWVFLSTFSALNNHSGVIFNDLQNPEFHESHHRFGNMAYGISGVSDFITLILLKQQKVQ
jgi:sterol desaturase/sphingolipid hydroxylase (fatty acid hydroxylase superfamily)